MTTVSAVDLVAAERRKQIRKGYTPEHDDAHVSTELTRAGVSYGITAIWQMFGVGDDEIMTPGRPSPELEWPWEPDEYRPSPHAINNLIKAAALIEADIDRLLRRANR